MWPATGWRGGTEHPASGDATGYATAYGLFLAAAVARMLGEKVRRKLTFGGDGGTFDLDSRRAVTLTQPCRGNQAGPDRRDRKSVV